MISGQEHPSVTHISKKLARTDFSARDHAAGGTSKVISNLPLMFWITEYSVIVSSEVMMARRIKSGKTAIVLPGWLVGNWSRSSHRPSIFSRAVKMEPQGQGEPRSVRISLSR